MKPCNFLRFSDVRDQTLGNQICQLENDHGNLALNDRLNEPGGRIMIYLKSQIGVASSQFVSAFIAG